MIARLTATMVMIALGSWGFMSAGEGGTLYTSLDHRVACMMRVLKQTPGVRNPHTEMHLYKGFLFPVVEFFADQSNSWMTQRRQFYPSDEDKGRGASFIATLNGLGIPPSAKLDNHVTTVVVDQWKQVCGVDANVYMA
jgi:hypothetical protein